jgi:type II secretory pathway component PulF
MMWKFLQLVLVLDLPNGLYSIMLKIKLPKFRGLFNTMQRAMKRLKNILIRQRDKSGMVPVLALMLIFPVSVFVVYRVYDMFQKEGWKKKNKEIVEASSS